MSQKVMNYKDLATFSSPPLKLNETINGTYGGFGVCVCEFACVRALFFFFFCRCVILSHLPLPASE